MNETLNRIKEFESILKKCLIETYGKYLPEDKIALLNITNYTSNDLLNGRTNDQIRGEMCRMMMDDLLNIECLKEIEIEDGIILPLPYGQSLESALIEYYTKKIATKYNFKVDSIEGLSLDEIKLLDERLSNTLDNHVFSEDAVELLNKANIQELVTKYDKEAIDEYFEHVNLVVDTSKSKEEENKLMMDNTQRKGSVQIVWLDDKKHIKYIDQDGHVHLTPILETANKTEEYYKSKLASLKPGETLDPEAFYYELKKYAEEMALTPTRDVKQENLNSEQIDMLSFINSNEEIRKTSQHDIITHNNEMTIHVNEETDDIIVTKDQKGGVSASIVKDGNAQMTDTVFQKNSDISSELISKEKYEELRMKYENGESLSLEELEALRRAAPIYLEEVIEKEENPVVLKPKYNNTGFSIKEFLLYIILTTLLIASIVAIILYK